MIRLTSVRQCRCLAGPPPNTCPISELGNQDKPAKRLRDRRSAALEAVRAAQTDVEHKDAVNAVNRINREIHPRLMRFVPHRILPPLGTRPMRPATA